MLRSQVHMGQSVQLLRFALTVAAFARSRRAVLHGSSSSFSSSVSVLSMDLCAAMGMCGAVTTGIWALCSPREVPGAAERTGGGVSSVW